MEQFGLASINSWTFPIIIIWTLFWKGYSLWLAVKNDQKKWFIIILILNTFGILEIFYVFYIAKKKWSDIKEVLTGPISTKKTENKE